MDEVVAVVLLKKIGTFSPLFVVVLGVQTRKRDDDDRKQETGKTRVCDGASTGGIPMKKTIFFLLCTKFTKSLRKGPNRAKNFVGKFVMPR